MSKVLIIGCGGVASVAIHKCCQVPEVFTDICIASRTKSKCDKLAAELAPKTTTKITTAQVDADHVDEVIALIRASEDTDTARTGLMGLLDIDQVQADAILAMQLRTLTRMNRDKIVAEHEELQRKIADYIDILAKPERQRKIIGDELDEIVAKYGDDRRTKILPFSGEMNVEDLIAEENVVVTVTHSGFIKRTKADEYRSQHRGGKGLKVHQLTEKTGQLTGVLMVGENDELMLITSEGVIIRLRGREISSYNRDSQGVKLMNLDDGVSVVGIAKISEEDIEEEAEETAAEAEKTEEE